MFYANNEQVKGIFLNGNSYNYLAYGFGKIIPEDRNAEQLNLNLARKYLNQYRIEFGTVKDGYDNALVSPRFDKPDSSGVFHTPFTYYYGGNIISTKEVPVLITNGNYALRNALVYNDMNINGAINYFATNTDFQGHNVNVFPEKDSYQVYQALLNYEMLNNCSNFDLNIKTRFSKESYPTLNNCNNFSGNFRYVGNQDYNYPGFRGFLYECKDGVFNIDCTNMHGGGSDANVTNYYNFSGIRSCENMNVNITGSSWQVWPHDHSFSSNCNINTYNVISGFSYMNYCNFNVVLPKDSKPEMSQGFEFLNNAENCNYNLQALDSNLFNYGSGVGHNLFFDRLNNCNLNLLVNNTVGFDYSFGSNFNNCNIVFDNIKADLATFPGWSYLNNCRITGNVVKSDSANQAVIHGSNNINVNLNFAGSDSVKPLSVCGNVNGSITLGKDTIIEHCNGIRLFNVNNGNLMFNNINHGNFNVYNAIVKFCNVNNTDAGSKTWAYVSALDNCHDLFLYDFNTVGGAVLENVYNSHLVFNSGSGRTFQTRRVNNCSITGFPTSTAYTANCRFDVGLEEALAKNSRYVTWANVWPHATPRGSDGFDTLYRTKAGLESVDNFSRCYLNCNDGSLVYSTKSWTNSINMECDIKAFYERVSANLKNYAGNIKLNVDCHNLNLGVFMAGPPHGFEYSSISADNIFCTTGNNYYVYMNYGTRVYCENFCNVPFTPLSRRFSDNYQPVLLINNYQHSNTGACIFNGGITRIGQLNYRGYMSVPLELYNGACMFINNTRLGDTIVDNALLFLGTKVYVAGDITVTNGGLVVNKANYSMNAISKFVNRNNFVWNFTDSGPWGSQSLLDYCTNV